MFAIVRKAPDARNSYANFVRKHFSLSAQLEFYSTEHI